jgi:selenocysteine-specific elongation factor
MRGFGAVVTGTLIAGEIAEGDELELLPAGTRVRVRGLQVHGSPVETAFAGQRTAINLGGVEAAAVERGMVLAPAGRLSPTQAIDASIQLLDNAPRPLRSRQRVRIHLGAAEALARVRVLAQGGEIKPGQTGFVQLRTEAPIVAALGDRLILRSYSPQVTIGGGLVLDTAPPRHRLRDLAATRAALEVLAQSDRGQQLAVLAAANRYGLRRAELAARTAWRDEVIDQASRQALTFGTIVNAEEVFLSRAGFDELKRLVLDEVAAHHQREPLLRGLPRETLRERWFAHAPLEVFRAVLASLEKEGTLISEREIVRLPEHTRELSSEDTLVRDRLEKIYSEAGLAAPALNEALARAGVAAQTGRKVLQLLIDAGRLEKVHGEMFFHRVALDDLIKRVRAHATKKTDRAIDVAAFKELAGISRKYAIPLLEYLDRQRVTRREGDRRIVL